MTKLIDNYLSHLNEGIGSFVASNVSGAVQQGAMWGLFYIPATILAWKSANALFSGAVRKCGGIRANTPGFQVCVAKERIKALNKKIEISKKILSGCHTAKDPQLCKQKFQGEIEKAKNRIEANKAKIEDNIGQGSVNEQLAAKIMAGAGMVGGTAIMLATGMVVDKAIFIVNRTAQAMFSRDVRKCGIYKDNNDRKICMAKIKLTSLNKKLNDLKNLSGKCNGSSSQAKCLEKINKHIEKTNRDIQIEKDNIISFQKEIDTEKREEQLRDAMKNN